MLSISSQDRMINPGSPALYLSYRSAVSFAGKDLGGASFNDSVPRYSIPASVVFDMITLISGL